MTALMRALKGYSSFKKSFHKVFLESLEKASQYSKGVMKMHEKWSKWGDDSGLTENKSRFLILLITKV